MDINDSPMHDVLVIGGGINGVGIANDAQGRGLSVCLCEQDDLASATSSASSKLIHGGLRYLEQYEFRLVRESLNEREVLLKKAPHIIRPQEFIMPYHQSRRPFWMIRLGLFLYDHLAKRQTLAASTALKFTENPYANILDEQYERGFSYADCWVDDARLVVLNAQQASENGAAIMTRTRVSHARAHSDYWEVDLQDIRHPERSQKVYARLLINAAGPWVNNIINEIVGLSSPQQISLVKGSHIVVPRLYEGKHAYILQNADQRVIFAIPYEENYTLVGTTDVPYSGDPCAVSIETNEVDYLCTTINNYFRHKIDAQDIVWSFSGVRPLQQSDSNNPATITRDYSLDLHETQHHAPLLSVFGGKITTYRKLAEQVLQKIQHLFPHCTAPWTKTSALPGGDMPNHDFNAFLQKFLLDYPWLPKPLATRYARSYGTRAYILLKNCNKLSDLGSDCGGTLYQNEIDYMIKYEWARSSHDILWRRSKLGLHCPQSTITLLNARFSSS